MDKRAYWRQRRQRCYEALKAEPYKELTKLAATDVETGCEADGYTLGAPIVGWLVTRLDGREWLGDTIDSWIDCLFRKINRGYTFLCHSEYELSYLCQYIVERDPSITLKPVTRKDGTFLAVKASKNNNVIRFINTMGVCNTSLERYLAAYAPNTPKQARDWGSEAAPNYWRLDSASDRSYLMADGRGLLEAYTNQRRETYANFGVNLRLTSGATAVAAHRATLPDAARYWRPHKDVAAFCRAAAHGGLVIAATTRELKDMVHIDRNAMYAWSERTFGAPVGTAMRTTRYYPDRPGFYRVNVTVPPTEHVPFIPFKRADGSLVWPVGETFEATITDIEYTEAQRLNYPIDLLAGEVFERREYVYNDFLNRCETMEHDDMDPVTGKKGVKAENAKGLRNPLSGKFGSGATTARYCVAAACPTGYDEVLSRDTGMAAPYLFAREEEVNAPHLQIHWYAYTTAGARVCISQLMREYHAVYADTDSLVLSHASLSRATDDGVIQLGTRYGEWKVEAEYATFQSGGPKNYLATMKSTGKAVSKTKGTPRKYVRTEDHRRALNGESIEVNYASVIKPLAYLKQANAPPTLARTLRRSYSNIKHSRAWQVTADGTIVSRKIKESG